MSSLFLLPLARGKVKHELRVTSSDPRVTSSNPRIASSNLWATNSNPRIRILKHELQN